MEELREFIKNFPGVIDYFLSKRDNRTSQKRIIVYVWIKQDEFDSTEVINILSDKPSFRETCTSIAKANGYCITFEIYYK